MQLLWKVLDEAFGESEAELFNRVDKELEAQKAAWRDRGLLVRDEKAGA